jgi:cobalt-zinc-cadmium efflux system outer membrane protein
VISLLVAFLLATPGSDASAAAEPELPNPLSLQEAEELFLAHGLDLLIAEAAVEGAEGDKQAAGALPNPIANGGAIYSFSITPGTAQPLPDVWGWTVGLSDNALVENLISGKHSLRVEGGAKAVAAAKLSRQDVTRAELSQLRQAYFVTLQAMKNVELAKDVKESFTKSRELNQIRFDKGDISQVDLSRIIVGALESEQAVAQADNALEQARTALAFLLGVRTGVPRFELSGSLDYRPIPALQQSSIESLLALALEHRPDLQAAVATREQKEAILSQARRQQIPDISLQASYTSQWTNANVVTPPTLAFGLSSPLPIFYQQQGEVRRALADLTTAQRQEAKARAQLVSDVTQAFSAYRTARELVERMEAQLLNQAKTARDLTQLQYQKGATSLLDFLDAQRTYIAINLEYHQDLASYWTAVYQLEAATAVPLK